MRSSFKMIIIYVIKRIECKILRTSEISFIFLEIKLPNWLAKFPSIVLQLVFNGSELPSSLVNYASIHIFFWQIVWQSRAQFGEAFYLRVWYNFLSYSASAHKIHNHNTAKQQTFQTMKTTYIIRFFSIKTKYSCRLDILFPA